MSGRHSARTSRWASGARTRPRIARVDPPLRQTALPGEPGPGPEHAGAVHRATPSPPLGVRSFALLRLGFASEAGPWLAMGIRWKVIHRQLPSPHRGEA